ncbi:MAG: leucine-rich repeat domain-containing protein, partial [Cytophagaceae bacterium]
MQGYRGNNCQRRWVTPLWLGKLCLMSLLTICLPYWSIAQQPIRKELTWYVSQQSSPSRYLGGSVIVEYSSLPDLAEKLARRTDKPYHLSIKLDKNPAAYWQQLRAIPPATSLAIELADSVMSDTLVDILANWIDLKRLDITGITGPRSYTIVTNAKGEKVFGSSFSQKSLPATGWDKLRSVQEVLLSNEIDLNQAINALRQLPALESLTVRQFLDRSNQNVPVELTGLGRLRKLTISGGISWNYKKTFSALPNLDELQLTDPDIRELNAGLPYLTKLTRLQITVFGQSPALPQLRLGGLTNLQTLYLMSRSQSAISLDSTLAGLTTLRRLSIEQTKLKSFPASLLANKELMYLSMPDADLETLPDQIDQLRALEELLLDNNPLHRLPAALCRLSRLNRLSVSKCELDSLPAAIGQLTSLTGLSLNSNLLTHLPTSMGQLRQLRQLNVAMNQLTELPAELGTLPKLETIAAFWNK